MIADLFINHGSKSIMARLDIFNSVFFKKINFNKYNYLENLVRSFRWVAVRKLFARLKVEYGLKASVAN